MARSRARMVNGVLVEDTPDQVLVGKGALGDVSAQLGGAGNTLATDAVKAAGGDVRSDGSVRRVAPGYRGLSEFLSHPNREVTRGEMLNFLSTLIYAERENTWWRKLYRKARRLPPVTDLPSRMYEAHERDIEEAKRLLLAQADELRAELSKRRGAESKEPPAVTRSATTAEKGGKARE